MPIEKNKPGNTIELATGRLVNNVWGAPSEETLASSIFQNDNGNIGWSWNRSDPKPKMGQTFVQPIYPCLRIGGNPWETSKSQLFPFRWGDVQSFKLEVVYNYTQIPTGAYDLAYDMFFTDSNKPGPNIQRQAEVMIWMNGTQKQPPTSYRGDFSDGQRTYALYSRTLSDGRLYAAFILKEPAQFKDHHAVDARRLMDNLKLDPEWYVHGVELGNEIWNGSGKIEISQVSVTLNGRHAQAR